MLTEIVKLELKEAKQKKTWIYLPPPPPNRIKPKACRHGEVRIIYSKGEVNGISSPVNC
jgi:hypothetical protein